MEPRPTITDMDANPQQSQANAPALAPMDGSQSDTPETDAECVNQGHTGFPASYLHAEFARKLERERDQARQWNAEGKINGARCALERDRLQDAVRNLRDVKGRHHTQQAFAALVALLPENASVVATAAPDAQPD